jgi:hypothetical protein
VYEDPDSFLTYEAEKILDARHTSEATWEYFTKWKNYWDDDNTWEPEDNFVERKCIVDYWADHPTMRILVHTFVIFRKRIR